MQNYIDWIGTAYENNSVFVPKQWILEIFREIYCLWIIRKTSDTFLDIIYSSTQRERVNWRPFEAFENFVWYLEHKIDYRCENYQQRMMEQLELI